MAALSNQIQLFGVTPATLTMSAMDNLDFIDPEEEAQMDEEQMQEEEENTIRGAREVVGEGQTWIGGSWTGKLCSSSSF